MAASEMLRSLGVNERCCAGAEQIQIYGEIHGFNTHTCYVNPDKAKIVVSMCVFLDHFLKAFIQMI